MSLSKIELNKENIGSNIKLFKDNLSKDQKLVVVVKANAYGHGLREIVEMTNEYADYFQVDDYEELKIIREVTDNPVCIFGYVADEELEDAARQKAIFGVYDLEKIRRLNEIGKSLGEKIKIHLKIDAFIGRQGILSDDVILFAATMKESEYIELEAVYSHFSNIEDTDDLDHARLQHRALLYAKDKLIGLGFKNIFHHISATSGFLTDQGCNWGSTFLRLGIGTYGLWPSTSLEKRFSSTFLLRPVLRWITKIAQIKSVPADYPIGYGITYRTEKEMRIAVVPQGYSDGYDRRLSNIGNVLIGGERCKILGRVAMNMFVVDVTDLENVKTEDEVVLIGRQGDEEITAAELADKIGSINYEVVARISSLLPKVVI